MTFHKREARLGGGGEGVIGNPLCKWQVILFALASLPWLFCSTSSEQFMLVTRNLRKS